MTQRLQLPDRPRLQKFFILDHPASHPGMCERGFTQQLLVWQHESRHRETDWPEHVQRGWDTSTCLMAALSVEDWGSRGGTAVDSSHTVVVGQHDSFYTTHTDGHTHTDIRRIERQRQSHRHRHSRSAARQTDTHTCTYIHRLTQAQRNRHTAYLTLCNLSIPTNSVSCSQFSTARHMTYNTTSCQYSLTAFTVTLQCNRQSVDISWQQIRNEQIPTYNTNVRHM